MRSLTCSSPFRPSSYDRRVPDGPGIPPPDVLPVRREASAAFRVARLLLGPLLHVVFRVEVSGRENIPQGPYVLIANHLNWPDGFLLLDIFPSEPRLHFLANPENLVKNRLHWALIRAVGGYIPVDMGRHQGPELFQHVDRCLQVGGVVVIFPEAAYGPTEGELQESWKTGFAHFAIDNGVPVLPVAISGTSDLWLRRPLRMVIGRPIASGGLSVDELAALGRRRLLEILPAYYEPVGRKPLRRFLTRLLY
jgi:1-acyl-sn-glycerol-3-phosphate acyltransferase